MLGQFHLKQEYYAQNNFFDNTYLLLWLLFIYLLDTLTTFENYIEIAGLTDEHSRATEEILDNAH